jgi:golgi to ER traffic protein 4
MEISSLSLVATLASPNESIPSNQLPTMPPRAHPTDPSKLLPPILRHLQSTPPDAYSAHQKARTTAARLIHSSNEDAAIEVLFGASKELLKVREWGSGCDLGCYLVKVYTEAGVGVTDGSRGELMCDLQ